MFRNEPQTHTAIRTLLGTIPRLDRYWTDTGPTEEAARLVTQYGGALSAGEWLLLRVGFDLWNGRGGADFGRVVHTLGSEPLAALGSLLVAISNPDDTAIDQWIARNARPAAPG
jgi:hypothetical protein